mmetsp:Transcript_43664/g.102498  ORF Transcript_43664/g.102498 Transcript_43664/m.102498 type:complete len:135 (+) Transcript_43664:37-441(+)
MRAFPASAAEQTQACGPLVSIIAGTGTQCDARTQAAADAGALSQIIAAMRACPASALQEQAFFALHIIADGSMDVDVDSRQLLAAIHGRSLNQIVEVLDARDSAVAEARFAREFRERESARVRQEARQGGGHGR